MADARGYSWPTATEGNTLAEKHGAHSERRWRPIAERLVAELVKDAHWLTRPAFRHSVWAWARAEARAQLVDEWLDQQATGEMPGDLIDGEVRSATGWSHRLNSQAESLRARLGIDPTAMARLLASFTVGVPGGDDVLASLRAEGARLVAASDAAGALPPPDDAAAHTATHGDVP